MSLRRSRYFRYERRGEPAIPRHHFFKRLMAHILVTQALVLFSLALGMAGYEHYESLPWRDAFLNSAMLLGGMGPVDAPHTNGGKLFAGFYALYAGLVFIVGATIIVAPLVHRIIHVFHGVEEKS